MDRARSRERARLQERVAKVVWGILFITMGVLFTLNDMGRIELSDERHEFAAARAVDGDAGTRWSSAFKAGQWLAVDLGDRTHVSRVQLSWETAYAKSYALQVSDDGLRWETVKEVKGTGGTQDEELDATARYVRVLGGERATPYGYSLWEFKVFDEGGTLVSQGRKAMASSEEDRGPFDLWFHFWPIVMVAAGLPMLLVPRDDSNQVIGIALATTGTALLLHNLGFVSWGLRQMGAGILVLVGAVILLQAGRRRDSGGDSETGSAGDLR